MAKTAEQIRKEEYENKVARRGAAVLDWLSDRMEDFDMADGVRVDSVQIKATPNGDAPYLCIMKGRDGENRPVVVFAGGDSAKGALDNMVFRAQERGLKWRDDTPWQPAAKGKGKPGKGA
jgi:hypothetical protein